ncbi:MAG: cell division protein ZapA [Treponema sp.]|nr:cell division protein ZapA [Spirochaetia bacterium]MDY2840366.1 cell division protein ZapA [Treponema sp.]MDY5123735.1 cell division protein ZapA [Treponema sp.]
MGKLHIEMLGTNFTIQANENTEYLEKLLSYYKKFTDDVNKIDSIKSPLQVAIVSGIMLCDELYKEKQTKVALEQGVMPEELLRSQEEMEKRTIQMLEDLNKVL